MGLSAGLTSPTRIFNPDFSPVFFWYSTGTRFPDIAGMPYIITEPCIGVKDASCIEVCPVDCIISTDKDDMYYIDPETCIDCSYCESVCPVNAIFDEFTVPSKWREYIRNNREYLK